MGTLDWMCEGADWPHRAASRFIEAGGLTWHVQDHAPQNGARGKPPRPIMLLIHGTGASSHSWRDLVPPLTGQFRLIVPDLPGHAFTSAFRGSHPSLPNMARALGALLEALKVAPDIIVGHSAGAAIAIRLALDGRVGARAIIGINAALLPFGGMAEQLFPPLARLLVLNPFVPRFFAWQAGDPGAVRRLIQSTGSRLDPEGLDFYRRLFRSHAHVEATLAMMAHWDLSSLRREIAGLAAPLSLIVGLNDRAVSPEDARAIRRLHPATRLNFMRQAGHLCHEEKPDETARLIGEIAGLAGLSQAA